MHKIHLQAHGGNNLIHSMTAFSRHQHQANWGELVWEIRTVNHRYLEISFRCPESFRHLEMSMREIIQDKVGRGKVEANLKLIPGEDLPYTLAVNEGVLSALSQAHEVALQYFPKLETSATDLLNWKGVLQTVDTQAELLAESALDSLRLAVDQLVETRHREGEGLREFLINSLDGISAEVVGLQKRVPDLLLQERARIQKRFEECQINCDEGRLEQEMVLLSHRLDVTEELQRLTAHLEEVRRVIDQGGVIGRRLDFLMQELNREANTLSSKSLDHAMTCAAVEMKVLIEQMREQVQNIE